MSEPVGHGSRLPNIPGNSLKDRQQQNTEAPASKEPPAKVIEGKVVIRKTPWWRKAARSLIADDASSVGEYLVYSVAIPAFRNLIRELTVGAIDKTLYGGQPYGRPGLGGRRMGGPVTHLRDSVRYDRMGDDSGRTMSREARNRFDFGEVILGDVDEANRILELLHRDLEQYNSVSVADLFGYLGVSSDYTARGHGWRSLAGSRVRQTPQGFVLDLPHPQPLSR